MLREGRLKWIKSYIARNASFFDRHTHSDTRVAMAVKFLLELISEVERLRSVLRSLANANVGISDPRAMASHAADAIKEPDLGPPDFVYRRFNVLDKEGSTNPSLPISEATHGS